MAKATTKTTTKPTAGGAPKTLVIAEKPSVASDIAKALGGFTKFDDYFENDQFVVSSAVGHLLEIAAPEEYDVKRGKWSFANLPVVPPHFDLRPIIKTESRLKVLQKLIKRKDITVLVNACDAGREGELIFRLIAQHAKASQPVKRLWLQSMTPNAIRDGFNALRSDVDMQPLADAGATADTPASSMAAPAAESSIVFMSRYPSNSLCRIRPLRISRPDRCRKDPGSRSGF